MSTKASLPPALLALNHTTSVTLITEARPLVA